MTSSTHRITQTLPGLLLLLITACGDSVSPGNSAPVGGAPGDERDMRPFAGIAEDEIVTASGTEPFWSVTVRAEGDTLSAEYSDPETAGLTIPVTRFAGRNGVSWSGELDRELFALAATPGPCSDGMSDRSYPYFVMLRLRGETREGCAHTNAQPFTGPETP